MMFVRRSLIVALFGGSLLAACSSEVEWHYGPPGGLTGKTPPDYGDGGAAPAKDSGPPPDTNTLCGGKGPIDGGACAVSFKNDIYTPLMTAAGKWTCAVNGCHGGAADPQPHIDGAGGDTGAKATYTALLSFVSPKQATKNPYVNPCSLNPADSTFLCNLQGNCASADPGAPVSNMPLGVKPDPADIAKVETWLKCGAPNN